MNADEVRKATAAMETALMSGGVEHVTYNVVQTKYTLENESIKALIFPVVEDALIALLQQGHWKAFW